MTSGEGSLRRSLSTRAVIATVAMVFTARSPGAAGAGHSEGPM
ncbi:MULTISPECIES: hypothetical protein [Amycolatopsis]|uniref:Uncharacterized protein n=1 Tax=Amycolatopsis echigonensis TaxID=2576905 RepID=A0A2N3WNB6_9PSEU|nr:MULTISPECIES: hypothetical protein [Amycolatopsis]PKV95359.1 hypothetical protein ATK30_6274 [Amycolatopsis niigatensis]